MGCMLSFSLSLHQVHQIYCRLVDPCQQLACYQVLKETSLSAAAETITVQTVGLADVHRMKWATVYCSVACDFTITQNGTAATTTTLAVTSSNGVQTGSAVAFSASNVGAGTTLAKYSVPAGGTFAVSLSEFRLQALSATTPGNLNIVTSSITGTVRIQIKWITP